MMSGKLITQIWLTDLTLVTSLARLLDLLGNLEAAGGGDTPTEQIYLDFSRNLKLQSGNSSDVQIRRHLTT